MSVCLSDGQSVCLSVPNEFYSSVMLLVVYICCYSYCSLDYQINLQSYFAILVVIAAPQVKTSFYNKLYTSNNLVLVLCMMLYTMSLIILMLFLQHRLFFNCNSVYKSCQLQQCNQKLSIVQTIYVGFANKSIHLQFVDTKAIAVRNL